MHRQTYDEKPPERTRVSSPKPVSLPDRAAANLLGGPSRRLVAVTLALAVAVIALAAFLLLRPVESPTPTVKVVDTERHEVTSPDGSNDDGATGDADDASSAQDSASDAVSTEAPVASDPASAPPEDVIASLGGWWAEAGGVTTDDAGVMRYRSVWHIENGTLQAYDGYGNLTGTIAILPANVTRADLLETSGWYFHDLHAYKPDDRSDTLWNVAADGSGYSGTSSHGRLDAAPQW